MHGRAPRIGAHEDHLGAGAGERRGQVVRYLTSIGAGVGAGYQNDPSVGGKGGGEDVAQPDVPATSRTGGLGQLGTRGLRDADKYR